MAKKKKQSNKIWVKKPKQGQTYYFRFAGGIMKGTLDEPNEKLSDYYNVKWFWMRCDEGESSTRYPVSIYHISEEYNNLKSV
jgi:hypothetical protein